MPTTIWLPEESEGPTPLELIEREVAGGFDNHEIVVKLSRPDPTKPLLKAEILEVH